MKINTALTSVFLLLLFSCSSVYDQGEVVEDFTLPTVSGDRVSLHDYRGKVVFIEFFNTW